MTVVMTGSTREVGWRESQASRSNSLIEESPEMLAGSPVLEKGGRWFSIFFERVKGLGVERERERVDTVELVGHDDEVAI